MEIIKKEEGENLAWHQQKGEKLKEYSVFEIYLSLGANRTISEVARKANLSRTTVTKYATKCNWHERALMHDKFYAEMNRSKNSLIIEELQKEIEKEFIKTEIYIQRAIIEINNFLRDFWAHYDNPRTIDKVKYINKLVTTLSKMYKMINPKMPNNILNEISIRNININNMLNLNQNINKIKLDKDFATKQAYEEIEGAIKPEYNSRE